MEAISAGTSLGLLQKLQMSRGSGKRSGGPVGVADFVPIYGHGPCTDTRDGRAQLRSVAEHRYAGPSASPPPQ